MKRNLRAQADYRKTILRNQLTSLVLFESIVTTKPKGKELVPFANRFFNRVRSGNFNAKRLAAATLLDPNAIRKVFEEIMPRYDEKETTFVRHLRVAPRKGDSAQMIMVALIRPLAVEATPKQEPKVATKTTEKTAVKGAA